MDTYPARGRTVTIDFGSDGPFGRFAAVLDVHAEHDSLRFRVTEGSLSGKTEQVAYGARQVAGSIWVAHWQEEDLLTVVQAQDFATGRLVSVVTTADQQMFRLEGELALA